MADDMALENIGGDMIALGVHAVFWTLVLIMIEAGLFKWWDWLPVALPKNRVPPLPSLQLDDDVLAEEELVKNSQDPLPVKVDRFRKIYPSVFRKPVVAVERTSFSVGYGECFALLGVNGAGKTTTFRALTHPDMVGSHGTVQVMGKQLANHFKELRKHIGYCP